MLKNKVLSLVYLNIFVAILLFVGCGKKEGTDKTDSKTDSKTDTKTSDNMSPDQAFLVEFEIKNMQGGKLTGIYQKDRVRTMSDISTGGVKMHADAYVPGDGFMYVVSEFNGMKTGMKWDTKKFAEQSGKQEGQYDVSSWKDKLKDMNKAGTETILGRECTIYEAPDKKYKFSLYKEMAPLKFYSGDKVVLEATKFEPDYKISDDTFTPPKDVKYSEGSNMMNGMKDMKNLEGMKDKMKEMEDAMKKYKK